MEPTFQLKFVFTNRNRFLSLKKPVKLWITISLMLSLDLIIALILKCEQYTHRLPKRTQRDPTGTGIAQGRPIDGNCRGRVWKDPSADLSHCSFDATRGRCFFNFSSYFYQQGFKGNESAHRSIGRRGGSQELMDGNFSLCFCSNPSSGSG